MWLQILDFTMDNFTPFLKLITSNETQCDTKRFWVITAWRLSQSFQEENQKTTQTEKQFWCAIPPFLGSTKNFQPMCFP